MDAVVMPAAREAAAASLLGDAFYEDPFVRWMYPSDHHRRERFGRLMTRLLSVTRPVSHVLQTADLGGCALWIPPGAEPLPLRGQLRMIPELPRMGGRVAQVLMALDFANRQHPKDRHWYLFVVGSAPALRGHGHGKAVIEPVLAECDRSGTPAYLESSNPDNVGYYERFGFRVTGELSKAGSPPLIRMWRDANAG